VSDKSQFTVDMKPLGSGRHGEQISVLSPKCDDRHGLHHTNAQSRDSTGDTQACVSCEKALTERWIPGSIGAYENKNDWIDVGDLLFWGGFVLRRRSTDGHVETERN
jgi:hypothetical protein